ncbi:MAG TPA: Tad domain-containing protein [Candidatus Limnocylindrales bacterium]|nr:Tad domain-containing protein [Candidatus Limnocylindrales bacterium]
MNALKDRHSARGQILVIAVLALVALVGMTGLVIDGGALFAQQRTAQNGSDAAATAGAVVVAENLGSATDIRSNADVYNAINSIAGSNGLGGWSAEYTDDFGNPIGVQITSAGGAIPAAARGVRAGGSRSVSTTFSRVFGFDQIQASAQATVVAGELSGQCVLDADGCTLLPLTFPVTVSQCDSSGSLIYPGTHVGAPPPPATGVPYYPIVPADDLPSSTNPTGNLNSMAILPLCKSSSGGSGAYGWLDLDPNIPNLPGEINGPLTVTVNIPDWFRTQPGNPNSVEDELLQYYRQPVLIPLNNGACRINPGAGNSCPAGQVGVDPVGNNTWYYVHTLAVFYIEHVYVQGGNVDQCASAPGSPLVPTTSGTGFLGCLKGWFVNYVTSGPILPGQPIVRGQTAIGIQLIK